MAHSSISAAVLIGGHSRRMGRPKALLQITRGDPTLIERTVGILRTVADDVFLVGAAGWPLPTPLSACRLAIDEGTSAADGVVMALDAAMHRFCIVVACDMPFLDAGLLRKMCGLALRSGRGVMVSDSRRTHPLHAVWDRETAPALHAAIERGERSLGALALLADMASLEVGGAGQDERERWSVFNVNTPDDLAVARARAARMR